MFKRRGKLIQDDITDEELDELIDDADIEDDKGDDYLDTKLPRRHISTSTIVMTLMFIILVGGTLFLLRCLHNEYKNLFPSNWCSCRVNENYLKDIDTLGSDEKSYIVSPMGIDLSLLDLDEDLNFEDGQKLSIVASSDRGYQSLGDSDAKFLELTNEESYQNFKNIENNTSTEIMDYMNKNYEIEQSFLKDTDIVNVMKLPSKLKGDAKYFDGEVYITGNYYKAKEAFKLDYTDNLHELVVYKDKLPDEDTWQEVNGTLVIPETSATYTTSSSQTIKGILGDRSDTVGITQVIHFEIVGSGEPENLEYTNKVGGTYNVLIRNKNSGLIVAGGVIRDE